MTRELDLNVRNKLVKCYIWSTALYGVKTSPLRKVDHKYLESFEMWCCKRMEKMSWTDRVRNEEVLHRVVERQEEEYQLREDMRKDVSSYWMALRKRKDTGN